MLKSPNSCVWSKHNKNPLHKIIPATSGKGITDQCIELETLEL
jgi:hypothetical protein